MPPDFLSYPSSSFLDCNVYYRNDGRVVLIGRLWRHGDGATIFQYDKNYISSGLPPLCLSMPINNGFYPSNGLHPYFCNLISEGWLEQVQAHMLTLGVRAHRDELLARFGSECIGPVKLVPNVPYDDVTDRHFRTVAKIMASKMNALLPGVQPKLLVIMNKDGTCRFPSDGETSTHIVKLQFEEPHFYAAPENEYVTSLLMGHLLPNDKMCDVRLGRLADIPDNVLFIKRFDRSPTGKPLDFREFNQLLGYDTDDKYMGAYKDMADFIIANDRPDAIFRTDRTDVFVLFNRIIASILLGNSDTHMKNFGLLKGGDNIYRLSPNYDLLCCSLYKGSDPLCRDYDTVALRIGATKANISMKKLEPKHIIALGEDFGFSREVILKCVSDIGKNMELLSPEIVNRLLPEHYIPGEIFQIMKKRWNSTFSGVAKLIAHKESCSRNPIANATKLVRTRPSPSSSTSYLVGVNLP